MPGINFKEIARLMVITMLLIVFFCVLMALVIVMTDVSFSVGYMLIDELHACLGIK